MANTNVLVIIQNLPAEVDTSSGNVLTIGKEILINIFKDYDFNQDENEINLVARKHNDGIPYAYAIIRFNSIEQAMDAITDLNYLRISEKPIYLKLFDEKTKQILYEGTGKFLIKNLSPDIHDDQLFATLSKYGEVLNCIIPSDDEELYPYAIVQFRDQHEAQEAISDINNALLNGKQIEILPYYQEKICNIDDLCKNYHYLIAVSGQNNLNQILCKSNNENNNNEDIISPLITYPLSVLPISFSVYSLHSIIIMQNLNAIAIGDNSSNQVNYFNVLTFLNWTPIQIRQKGKIRFSVFTSAVCGKNYTLFLCNLTEPNETSFLALSCPSKDKNSKRIDIKNQYPISLYGGEFVSAAIFNKGWFIIIPKNHEFFQTCLPNNKIAIQLACMNKSVIALSSDGLLYELTLQNSNRKFALIKSVAKIKFSYISGTSNHILAVSEDGTVYSRGLNDCGQLGIESKEKTVTEFTPLKKFSKREIVSVFAGRSHSLFVDEIGAVYACGSNKKGELMIDNLHDEFINRPVETNIHQDASFCIAGDCLSVVFFYKQPPCMPNANSRSNGVPEQLYMSMKTTYQTQENPEKQPKKEKQNPTKKTTENENEKIDNVDNDRFDQFVGEIKDELNQILDQIAQQNRILNQLSNNDSVMDDLNVEIEKFLNSNK